MTPNDGALEYALRVLRRRKILIITALISVPLCAFLYSTAQTKEYTATATLLFESESEAGLSEASREAATIETIASLPAVALKATEELGSGAEISEVLGKVEVASANEMANLITVSATSESPDRAAEIANAYSKGFIAFMREADRAQANQQIAVLKANLDDLNTAEAAGPKGELLRERLNELEVEAALKNGNTQLVQEAAPPGSPSSPKTTRNVVIGVILGLVLGLGLAALIERLDRRVRSAEELEELFGVPIISRIPRCRAFQDKTVETMMRAPEAEAFRTLRTNLRYLKINRDLHSLLIASPEPNDGKSTVCRGLAGAMVEMGDDVVLVEADLRKDSAFRFSLDPIPGGLSSVLAGASLDGALMEVPVSRSGHNGGRALFVLPSGPIPPNPSELLESERMREVLVELGERFETVLIDSPAIGVVGDAMSLVPHVSGIIAVGGLGKTSREGGRGFAEQLELIGSHPLGLIVTMTSESRSQYAYYRRSQPLQRR